MPVLRMFTSSVVIATLHLLTSVWAISRAADNDFTHRIDDSRLSFYDKELLDSLEFLIRWQPARDRRTLDLEYLEENIRLALHARHTMPWHVPDDIFLNYVLPYASMTEQRDRWRPLFFERHSRMLSELSNPSLRDAALFLSRNIWQSWNVTFKSNLTPEVMSPFQTIAAGHASCTGMSILLVNACRAVGIPARVTGTPVWNDGSGGNHDWVEVWFEGGWSFMDAYDGHDWNTTWFYPSPAKYQQPNAGNFSIYATSWQSTESHFPLAWDFSDRSVPAIDVTSAYVRATEQA